MQSLQAARPQTEGKHKVTLQRLGKDEYNLLNLVTCLNDFDPVELVENSVDAPDLSSDVISPEYQEGVPIVKVKGSLERNVAFWEHIGASRFIRDTIVFGYKIPFIYTPPVASFGNNRSAIQHSKFVEQAISDLLVAGSVVECGCAPTVVNPLSVSIQANGKKRLILSSTYGTNHLPTVHCYADDTQLYLAFQPDDTAAQEPAVASMEACIQDIRNWMTKDSLKINGDKTEVILIGTKAQLKKVKIDNLAVGDSKIVPSTEAIRNLGCWFDNNFTMNAHVTKTCKAGFFYLHNICRIRKFLTQEITEKLIHAFVTSRLDYCNSLLYGLPSNLLAKLQRVQNAAARLIHRAPRFCHTTPLLVDLHWLDIKSRIDFKIILLTFKAIHGQAPAYICELVNLKPYSSYGLRSNNRMLLSTPNFRTLPTLGDRAFAAAAPKLWNTIPLSIRQEQNLEHFKKKLKTYLFLCNYKSMDVM